MILNLSQIKTEALLLFCKDLILSYKDKDKYFIDLDKNIYKYINDVSDEILKQIIRVTFTSDYYLKNSKHYRIKAVLEVYNYINIQISRELENKKVFNPAMLYFSLLSMWFNELSKEKRSKEYIFFILYPYANIYDKLLLNIKNKEFKNLNVSMIEISEKVIYNLDFFSFKKKNL